MEQTASRTSRAAKWVAENADAFGWIVDNEESNSFAASLARSLDKWGSLTPKQLSAVKAAITRAKAMKDKRDNAPTVSLAAVEEAFKRATDAGIAHPKLRLGDFTLSPAPMNGKNPNAIYVKGGGEYLGKVLNSRLFTVSSVSPQVEQAIVQVASDPLNAAIAFGKKWGKCAVCARTLTDEESIAKGIGPVCAKNFGWGV
jgi:hypothetical protein